MFLVNCIKSMDESVQDFATQSLARLLRANVDDGFAVFFAHAIQSVERYPVVAASYGKAILSEIRSRPQYYVSGFRCKLYVIDCEIDTRVYTAASAMQYAKPTIVVPQ
jgi:hypothetical protein